MGSKMVDRFQVSPGRLLSRQVKIRPSCLGDMDHDGSTRIAGSVEVYEGLSLRIPSSDPLRPL